MRMWRNIVILIVVFAVLIAAYYFVKVFEPGNEGKNDNGERIVIFQTEKNKITKLEIKNAADSFAFVRQNNAWAVEGREYMELNQSSVDSLAYDVASLTTDTIVTSSPSNLSDYGIEKPIATTTVTLDDGSVKTFYLGDLTPTKTHYYFKDSEKPDIYIIPSSKGDSFSERLLSFRIRDIVSIDKSTITGITIQKADGTIELQYNPPKTEEESYGYLSLWSIKSPIVRGADNEKVDSLILTPISSIYADNIVEDNPTDLSKYRIGETKVTITTKDKTINFMTGTLSGNTYLYLDGKTSVFSVAQGAVSFLNIKAFDIMEQFVTLPVIDKVSQIDVTSPSVSGTLKIERQGESVKYLIDSTETNEDAFKSMYQAVIGLTVDGMVTKTSSKQNLLCKIVYTMTDGTTQTIEIYPYDDLNVSVYNNGENLFFMKKKKLTELLNTLTKFKANPSEKVA